MKASVTSQGNIHRFNDSQNLPDTTPVTIEAFYHKEEFLSIQISVPDHKQKKLGLDNGSIQYISADLTPDEAAYLAISLLKFSNQKKEDNFKADQIDQEIKGHTPDTINILFPDQPKIAEKLQKRSIYSVNQLKEAPLQNFSSLNHREKNIIIHRLSLLAQ